MQAAAGSRKEAKRHQAAMDEPIDLGSPDCELMAIRQFTCTYIPNKAINCKPLQRLFMICGGRSLEVTQLARPDITTGELSLPQNMKSQNGKHWHDLHAHA